MDAGEASLPDFDHIGFAVDGLLKRLWPYVKRWKDLTNGYTCVILFDMKTAISLPDRLYEEAEKTAHDMGIPRSQLFAKALEEFIASHRRDNVTERLNRVYAGIEKGEFSQISRSGLESIRNLTENDTW